MAPAKLTLSTAPARRVCVGCDMLMEPARPGAPLCRHCAPDPAGARERIVRRGGMATSILAAAAAKVSACLAALTPEERERWHQFERARKRKADGEELPPKLLARLAVAADAMAHGSAADPMGAPGLVALYAADEAWFWAGCEHAHHTRRAEGQIAVLDAWLSSQQEAAHAAD